MFSQEEMVRREKAKTATLILVAVCLIVCLLSPLLPVSLSDMGLSKNCGLTSRLCYSFFHASIYHLAGNCWVLLCIVFYYELPLSRLFISYIIAVTAPAFSDVPTIGLSAVVYCLLGQASYLAKRQLYFHFWVGVFIYIFGIIVPLLLEYRGVEIARPNNLLHVYCYVAGLVVGFFNSPMSLWRRRK